MLLVFLFGGFITNLPCHVVNFQSDACVSQAILKYKTDSDIKEVIILAVFTMLTFNPYYYPSPPLWYMVFNRISSFLKFCHYHKGWGVLVSGTRT